MNIFKFSKHFSISLILSLLCIACGDDDQSTSTPDQNAIMQIMTGGSNKTWKISEAILTNDSGNINISSNFNVVDDEFLFSNDGNLEWRIGNDINIEGTTNSETLLDFYLSPVISAYNFNSENNTDLSSIDGRFNFTVLDDVTITGTITFEGRIQSGGELNITLTPKKLEDFPNIPENGLHFTELFTFQSNSIVNLAPGMIGSYSDNSLFIATIEDPSNKDSAKTNNPERTIKFNIDTGTSQEYLFLNEDYVSKQLHIIDNQLVIIGGQYVNTYPLDLSTLPVSTTHGIAVTRFGTATTGTDVYIIGGDINVDGDENVEAEKVYKWNLSSQSLEYVFDLPEKRFGARATIVNDKLYVFGGTSEFEAYGSGTNSIYIYDINNGTIVTKTMPSVAEFTYVDKFQNLIYVGGRYDIMDTEGNSIDREFTLGVYDTENGIFQEIETNLSQEGYNSIYYMCIFNNKMYVIYGHWDLNSWQVMVADLN